MHTEASALRRSDLAKGGRVRFQPTATCGRTPVPPSHAADTPPPRRGAPTRSDTGHGLSVSFFTWTCMVDEYTAATAACRL